MSQTRLSVFVVTALLSVAVAVSGNDAQDPTLKEIAGYRQWTRVTAVPVVNNNPIGAD
jgi:hypothetical protein